MCVCVRERKTRRGIVSVCLCTCVFESERQSERQRKWEMGEKRIEWMCEGWGQEKRERTSNYSSSSFTFLYLAPTQ